MGKPVPPQARPRTNRMGGATRAVCEAFIVSTWLSMFALAVLRAQWTYSVWRLAAGGESMDGLEEPSAIGPIFGYVLVLWDKSLLFYGLAVVSFILLVLFARNVDADTKRRVVRTLKVLAVYSATMIVAQVLFLALLRPPGGRAGYLYNTCLRGLDAPAFSGYCIDDPHYVTFGVALGALLLMASPQIAESLRGAIKQRLPTG